MRKSIGAVLLAATMLLNACQAKVSADEQNITEHKNESKMSTENNIKAPLIYQIRESKSAQAKLVVMMHGFGSNDADLFSLAPYFPEDYIVVSLQAPVHLGGTSYQWFTIINGNNISIEKQEAEVNNSEALIVSTIKILQEKYNVPAERTFIGGFSQGGIMSYQIGLKDPSIANGIFVMSGRMLSYLKASTDKLPASGLNIFIGHGEQDNVLNFTEATNAKLWLENRKYKVTFKSYKGLPHSIAQEEIKDVLDFINASLK